MCVLLFIIVVKGKQHGAVTLTSGDESQYSICMNMCTVCSTVLYIRFKKAFLPPELFSPSPTQPKCVHGVSMERSVRRGATVDLMSHATTSLGHVCVRQVFVETSAISVSTPSDTVSLSALLLICLFRLIGPKFLNMSMERGYVGACRFVCISKELWIKGIPIQTAC